MSDWDSLDYFTRWFRECLYAHCALQFAGSASGRYSSRLQAQALDGRIARRASGSSCAALKSDGAPKNVNLGRWATVHTEHSNGGKQRRL